MTRVLRSLSNRIFLASAALAVLSILAAVTLINRTVTEQAELEIAHGLNDAATSVEAYRRLTLTQLWQSVQLVADLPRFKAAVELNDPPTVAPLAEDYRDRLGVDVLVVLGRGGRVLAEVGVAETARQWQPARAADFDPRADVPHVTFLPQASGILQVVTLPIWIDPAAPDVLGTLIVGVALDSRFAGRIKGFTDSDVVFAWDGRVRAGTLPADSVGEVERWVQGGSNAPLVFDDEEYSAIARPLLATTDPSSVRPAVSPATGPSPTAASAPAVPRTDGSVIVLRSRTQRLRPLKALHRALAAIALTAVLMATLISFFVAQTVTRPIRAITARMRDLAGSGDLTRGGALDPGPAWGDEDAGVLVGTFNSMTASLERFQREAAQRERLSSLGRLSTVIAHEIRNPLMIIKSALRSLRRNPAIDQAAAVAVADIDEEVVRLNGLVNGVLDFARPIRFAIAPASLSALCEAAVAATVQGEPAIACAVSLDPAADEVQTDAERLRQVLVNVLTNAKQAVAERASRESDGVEAPVAVERRRAPVTLRTEALERNRVRIVVADRGTGLDPQTASRVFDPFFTTKTTGTGIGLAITRNIIDGLGGTIALSTQPGSGTEVTIELPRTPAPTVEQNR